MIYTTMAVAAAVGLIWRMKVAHAAAVACAPVGAWFTVVALGTGMLWGKPMWGAYWVWDPRLTSELILLFLYLGYMGLRAGIEDPVKADKASAVLAVVGVVNVPIIKYSVEWWNSLHQTPTVMQMYFIAVLLTRLRAELLRRERNASWVREVVAKVVA
jgi:heme exporter protein C